MRNEEADKVRSEIERNKRLKEQLIQAAAVRDQENRTHIIKRVLSQLGITQASDRFVKRK